MFNKKLIFFLFVLFLPQKVLSDIIYLSCDYLDRKINIIIDIENKKIKRDNYPYFNYRYLKNSNETIIINEMIESDRQLLTRYTLNLNNFQNLTEIVKVTMDDIIFVRKMLDDLKDNKIKYDKIDNFKIKLFEKYWINPKKYKDGRVVFNWRKNNSKKADAREYLLYKGQEQEIYQSLLVSNCEIKS